MQQKGGMEKEAGKGDKRHYGKKEKKKGKSIVMIEKFWCVNFFFLAFRIHPPDLLLSQFGFEFVRFRWSVHFFFGLNFSIYILYSFSVCGFFPLSLFPQTVRNFGAFCFVQSLGGNCVGGVHTGKRREKKKSSKPFSKGMTYDFVSVVVRVFRK